MIIALCKTKNSSDIIESFIRYNANIVDHFLVLENNSADNTKEILNLLKSEGYSIEISYSNKLANTQSQQITELMHYALQNYNPDYLIPLDDDEFIISSKSNILASAKKTILNLPQDYLYQIRCRTYCPDITDKQDEIDPVKKYMHYYPGYCTRAKKCILPANLIDSTTCITQGSHRTVGEKIRKITFSEDIELAHYPYRSIDQLITKILIGCWKYLLYPDSPNSWGTHYKKLYQYLKEGYHNDQDIIDNFINKYITATSESKDILINNDFFSGNNLSLKYTKLNNFNMFLYLSQYVETIIQQFLQK